MNRRIRKELDRQYNELLMKLGEISTQEEFEELASQMAELQRQRLAEKQSRNETLASSAKWLECGIAGISILVSSKWLGKALKFEETGALMSSASRWVSGIKGIFRR